MRSIASVMMSVSIAVAAACSGKDLVESDVLAVQAAVVEYLAGQRTPANSARVCVRVATASAEMDGIRVAKGLKEAPKTLVERLQLKGVVILPYSACDVKAADLFLTIGLPTPTANGAQVSAERVCGFDCGGGFAVDVRKSETGWRAVGAQPTWIP